MNMTANKKARISQACNACRQRKSKCGGERPSCKACRTTNKKCIYHDTVRKRGLQSGYVRNLEILLGLTVLHFPESDSKLRTVLRSRAGQDLAGHQEESEALVKRWRNSACAKSLEGFLENAVFDEPLGMDSPSRLYSPPLGEELADRGMNGIELNDDSQGVQEFEYQEMERINVEIVNEYQQNQHIQNVDERSQNLARHHENGQSQAVQLIEKPLPSSMSKLVDFYLAQIHCWFPIIRRGDLFKSMQGEITADSPCRDRAMRLCLWAILALVSTHRAVETPQVDALNISGEIRHALIDEDADFDICHVQALLVLIILHMALDQLEVAWLMSAQASRMVVGYLARNVDSDDRTARTLRGCMFLDFLLSAYLDRTSCLSHKDMHHLRQKLDLDSSDEWQPGETWSNHTTSVKSGPLRALSNLEYIMDMISSTSGDTNSLDRLNTNHILLAPACPPGLSDSSTVSSIVIGPAVLNVHLMRFFLLLRHETSDPRQLQEFTNSTNGLVRKYMEQAGSVMAMPSISLYLREAAKFTRYRSAAAMTQAATETRQSLDCNDLWIKSQGMWLKQPSCMPAQNSDATSTQFERHQAQQGVLRPTGIDELPPNTSFDNLANTHQLSNNAHYMIMPNDISRSMFDETHSAQTLDELSPLMPVDRSGQTPIFAHNLGFINEDWEHDWYASAQFQGNVADPG